MQFAGQIYVKQTPPLLKLALIALAAAPFLTVLAMMQAEPDVKRGLLHMSAGLLSIGIGEILNHPLQTGCNYTENQNSELRRFQHRRRNPCSLGNILFIAGMLLLCIGLNRFIPF